MARDSLRLTSAQRKTAFNDITKTASAQGAPQRAPKGFSAKIGAAIPKDLTTQAMPVKDGERRARAPAVQLRHVAEEDRDREPERQKIAG